MEMNLLDQRRYIADKGRLDLAITINFNNLFLKN